MAETRGTTITQGTQVPMLGFVGPFDVDSDNYPSHIDRLGAGGLMSVADLTERDAIPNERRVEGMMVYVSDGRTYYSLDANLATWTAQGLTAPAALSAFAIREATAAAFKTLYTIDASDTVPFVITYEDATNITVDRLEQPPADSRGIFLFW